MAPNERLFGIISSKPIGASKEARNQTRKLHDMKLAFSEFYLSLVLLQNYQNLNWTGFRKILKKHDKLMGTDSGVQWRYKYVDVAHFYTNKVYLIIFINFVNLIYYIRFPN